MSFLLNINFEQKFNLAGNFCLLASGADEQNEEPSFVTTTAKYLWNASGKALNIQTIIAFLIGVIVTSLMILSLTPEEQAAMADYVSSTEQQRAR